MGENRPGEAGASGFEFDGGAYSSSSNDRGDGYDYSDSDRSIHIHLESQAQAQAQAQAFDTYPNQAQAGSLFGSFNPNAYESVFKNKNKNKNTASTSTSSAGKSTYVNV